MVSACTNFILPLNQIVKSVKAVDAGARSSGALSDIWVLLDNVPPGLRSRSFLMAFGELISKPIELDLSSLDRLGPACMRIWFSSHPVSWV